MSQKSSESESSKSACAKSIDSKVADSATEAQHKTTEALKSEEKAMGKLTSLTISCQSSRCGAAGWAASLQQHQGSGSIPGPAQGVRDPHCHSWCRLQLWLVSHPWLGNSICLWGGPKRETKEKEKKISYLYLIMYVLIKIMRIVTVSEWVLMQPVLH